MSDINKQVQDVLKKHGIDWQARGAVMEVVQPEIDRLEEQNARLRKDLDELDVVGAIIDEGHAKERDELKAKLETAEKWDVLESKAYVELRAERDAKQYQIDELMLEYCPDDMTHEQIEEWGRNQKQAPPTEGE